MTTATNTGDRLLLFLYRTLVMPLAALLLPFAGLIHRKIGDGLRLRRARRPDFNFPARPVWIHAASGEFEYAKAVIRELKAARPDIPILVTYFSPTYAKNAANFPGVDLTVPLPLDLPGPCSSFLKRYQPRALLIARTDFWPEMLTQTRKLGIPISVFAYTQKDPSAMSAFTRRLARWRLSMVDHIYCVSPEDLRNTEAILPGAEIESFGDTRYDQVRFRLDHPKSLPAIMRPQSKAPVLIAGSTWSEDEAVLLPALTGLLRDRKLKLILVPHEPTPEHIRGRKEKLGAAGLDYVTFSSPREWKEEAVLLVDQTGWLAELYAWAQMAFIGGSFRKTVHSVMEALGASCLTLVGPKHLNNREAIDFQEVKVGSAPAVQCVRNADEFKTAIERLSKSDFAQMRPELERIFSQHLGASRKLAAALIKLF
jgi:3-deoxy-D-manno-octulosonic-acid transferase